MFCNPRKNIANKSWNEKYRQETERPSIHTDMPRIVEIFKKLNVKKVLDLGCGSGRHTTYLAQQGFEVYGIDISEEGIKKTNNYLLEKGLRPHLELGDIYQRLPYSDGFFDAIICIHTLHHGQINDIRQLVEEMKRILKREGLLFATLHRRRKQKDVPKERMYGIQFIAPRTYIMLAGREKGVPHYIFNRKIIKKEFEGFKSLDIWEEDFSREYCFLGKHMR